MIDQKVPKNLLFGKENKKMFDQSVMGMNPALGGGYMYTGQPNMQAFNNVLTEEQIKMLMQNQSQFSLAITEEESLRAQCNHRDATGLKDSLVFDPATGMATCTICGYTFRPIEADVSPDDIKDDVARIVDILQTIKMMYIDLPAEAAREFFPIIAMLNKIPQLFDFAAKNMAKHESFNWQWNGRNMGAINMFNNLRNILGGMNMGMPVNPAMQAAPMGAPYMNPPQGAPMPGMNPFGFPGANPAMMGGYAPQTVGYQFNPGQQAAPAAPQAPAAPADTTVTQNVTV